MPVGTRQLSWAQPSIVQVTCGSVIKLSHESTKHLLHSHEIAYGTGSGQQSVTGYSTGDDANSLWIVRGTKVQWLIAIEKPYRVSCILIYALATFTEQGTKAGICLCAQEAACLQGSEIEKGTSVRLQHGSTRKYLHSHHFPSPLSGNKEVSQLIHHQDAKGDFCSAIALHKVWTLLQQSS